nr:unnamed protein product [Callosobruchus chinensis]
MHNISDHQLILCDLLINVEKPSTLKEIKNDRFNGDDVAKSIGIKKVMLDLEFRIAMVVAKKILSTLQPADAALQARSAGLKDAITIIKCVENEIIKLRSDQMYNQILEEAKSLTIDEFGESENRTQTSKRQVKNPNRMDDYLMYGPSCSSARQNIEKPFKSEYFETLDILISELRRRFSDNDDLINSIASLDELDVDKMVPLKNLGLKTPSREEVSVVKAYLSQFGKLSIEDRIKHVQTSKLCINCLNSGHELEKCKFGPCRKCSDRHNSLLHQDSNKSKSTETPQTKKTVTLSNHNSTACQTLLSTALVKIRDKYGNTHSCRVLLDSASESNFITKSFCQRLGLSTSKVNISIIGISQIPAHVQERCNVEIASAYYSNFTIRSSFIGHN